VRRAVSGGIGTGIGRRCREVSFEREPIVSRDPGVLRQVRSFVRSIDDNLEAGRGLWFDGPVGTGKTSLAILVAKAAKDAGRSYAVYPVPRLLAEIKRTFDRDASDTYMGFFRRLCTVDVLVLDDLGAEKQTEWVLEQLYSIVNERWQDERSIVVTTNVPDPDPEAPMKVLRQSTQELREATRGHRSGDDTEDLRRLVERLERVAGELANVDAVTDLDPVARLRRQIGARTVSRLREICEEPLPVWGEDLRVAASGA
jgi:DNA replication protein DnaC